MHRFRSTKGHRSGRTVHGCGEYLAQLLADFNRRAKSPPVGEANVLLEEIYNRAELSLRSQSSLDKVWDHCPECLGGYYVIASCSATGDAEGIRFSRVHLHERTPVEGDAESGND